MGVVCLPSQYACLCIQSASNLVVYRSCSCLVHFASVAIRETNWIFASDSAGNEDRFTCVIKCTQLTFDVRTLYLVRHKERRIDITRRRAEVGISLLIPLESPSFVTAFTVGAVVRRSLARRNHKNDQHKSIFDI
jgi:hypothetical protein